VGVEHQRQEPLRLRFLRRQFDDDAPEPDRFFSQIASARIVGEGFRPTVRERGVDRLQRSIETTGQILALRDPERHAGEPDFRLGAGKALAHRGGRDEESRCDGGCVETQNRLQHQRRTDGLLNRRMCAGEHQREAPVGDRRLFFRRFEFVLDQRKRV
jgi:hypothetical protein